MSRYTDMFNVTESGIHGFFEDYGFLSNFHVTPICHQGIWYPSTENAYQALKTIDRRQEFVNISPHEAKKLGASLELSDEQCREWDSKRVSIMMQLNSFKYAYDEQCRMMLLDTGYKYLEETNYWKDTFWGVYDGRGENMLGRILMSIRDSWIDVLGTTKNVEIKGNNEVFNL